MNNNIKNTTSYIKGLRDEPVFLWLHDFEVAFPNATVYLVGGVVRDFILGRECHDYDIVISKVEAQALEEFLSRRGTVNLVGKSFGIFIFTPSSTKHSIEIALPRTEKSFNTGGYHDFKITADPSLPIEKDLKRRDFTINAIALNIKSGEIIDPFKGQNDIEGKTIKTVGSAKKRFKEDYTRMLRGVRFASQLNFTIDAKTINATKDYSKFILSIPAERIQHELNKILLSKNIEHAFNYLLQTQLPHTLIPELTEGVGMQQGKAHIYTVYDHLVKAAQYASEKEYPLEIIMAALFHDCGKPRTQEFANGVDSYHNHEYVGEKMTREALNRLKYPKDFIKKVSHLVKNHMFYYNTGEVSDAGVRRLISKFGAEHIDDLIRLRMSDRKGMGRPKAKPYKLLELEKRMKVLQTDPISVNTLSLDGDEIMKILNIKPTIRIKHLKNALMSIVLEDPSKNEREILIKELEKINKLSDEDLEKRAPNYEELETERKRTLLKGYKGAK